MAKQVNNVIDIDLSVTRKKRFRVDKDNDRILELNTSDLNIVARLKEAYPKLSELSKKIDLLKDEENIGTLKDIDKEMRELIDYTFDSNVSEICAPDGTMYDLFQGQFRFEIILDVLGKLYENNLEDEVNAVRKRIQKHTDKYTGK